MSLPTETYEISGWKGLADYGPETDYDPQFVRECQNVDFDEGGIIEKRRGVTVVSISLGGAAVNMIRDFQSQQGFTGTLDNQRVLIAAGSTLTVVRSFSITGQDASVQFATVNALHYVAISNNGACFVSNENGGIPKILGCVGGTFSYTSAALYGVTSAGPEVYAQTFTSSLTGIHQFQYTYEDIWGNESNPSPESDDTFDPAGHDIDLKVWASADPFVSLINIYCLTPAGTEFKFARTASNATQTISYSVSDTTVEVGDAVATDHYPCPAAKYLGMFNDMLIVGGDPTLPDAVYPSNWQFHRQFSTDKDIARAVSGDGQPIKGFGQLYNDILIAKADSIFLADGADNTQFSARPHSPEYGVLGQPSISFAYQKAIFFSDDGIYLDNSLAPEEISTRIRTTIRHLYAGNLATVPPKQCTENYKYYKKLFFAVREAQTPGDNDTILVWNYERDSWTRYTGITVRCFGVVQNADDYEYLYGGDGSGRVFIFNPPTGGQPNDDNLTGSPTAIDAYVKTPWLNFAKLKGRPDWAMIDTVPLYMILFAGGEPASGNSTISLVTNYYTDFSDTIRGTFTTTHNATTWASKGIAVDPKQISFGGEVDRCKWMRFKFSNSVLSEHFAIHKVFFGFKLKPAVDQ